MANREVRYTIALRHLTMQSSGPGNLGGFSVGLGAGPLTAVVMCQKYRRANGTKYNGLH